ncbi:prefoldin 5 [Prunus dulcis]|uniref:Prefoldin 5 n=1 Tax=Prunus dulcis TaxID=3755 RepID=A0A4Y1QS69_PRUDU|nr:prefoldin 5 [Prunus dulcis]
MEKTVSVNVRAEMEKLSPEQLKAVKEQTDMEVNLLQDSLNNIRTATTRLEIASSALHDLSLRPQGKKMLVPLTASLYVPAPSTTPTKSSSTSAPVTSSRKPCLRPRLLRTLLLKRRASRMKLGQFAGQVEAVGSCNIRWCTSVLALVWWMNKQVIRSDFPISNCIKKKKEKKSGPFESRSTNAVKLLSSSSSLESKDYYISSPELVQKTSFHTCKLCPPYDAYTNTLVQGPSESRCWD